MNVQIFTIKDIDVEVVFDKGLLTFGFNKEGKKYGNSVKPQSRKVQDIVAATWQLLSNAIETIDKLND